MDSSINSIDQMIKYFVKDLLETGFKGEVCILNPQFTSEKIVSDKEIKILVLSGLLTVKNKNGYVEYNRGDILKINSNTEYQFSTHDDEVIYYFAKKQIL